MGCKALYNLTETRESINQWVSMDIYIEREIKREREAETNFSKRTSFVLTGVKSDGCFILFFAW